MYSHELQDYVNRHNCKLNSHQLEFVMDTRDHPQITAIKYNDQYKSYDIYTSDNYHISFGSILYDEYCNYVKSLVFNNNQLDCDHYRLYIADPETEYTLNKVTTNILEIFEVLDFMILDNEFRHNRYIIVQYDKEQNKESIIYLGYGNKLDYLNFKRNLENSQKDGIKGLTLKR